MDEDEDEIAQVTYGIKRGGKGVFDVKEQTGIIHLRSQPLNSARKAQYKLKVAAIDSRGDRKAFEDAVLEILVENSANYLDFGSSSGYHFVVVELDNSIHHHRTISLHQTV
jgi:protocadherin Fat 4